MASVDEEDFGMTKTSVIFILKREVQYRQILLT
jgi:hypothetical protein